MLFTFLFQFTCLHDALCKTANYHCNKDGAVGSLQRQIADILASVIQIHVYHALLRVISAPNLSWLSTRTPQVLRRQCTSVFIHLQNPS